MVENAAILKQEIQSLKAQNITLQDALDKAIQEKRHFEHLIHGSRDVIWTMDMDMNFTFLSPSTEALFGYSLEERKNIKVEDLFTEQSLKAIRQLFNGMLNAGLKEQKRAHVLELEGVQKNGQKVWVEVNVQFIFDQHNKPIGMQGNTRDITRRKMTERKLKDERFYWEKSFEHAHEGMVIINENSEIIQCNNTFAAMVGKNKDEVIGQRSSKIVHNSDKHVPYCSLDHAIKLHKKYDTEYWEPFLDKYLKVNASPFYDEVKKLSFVFIIYQDVTHEKAVEKELIESERKYRFMFNRMITGFALHEMIYDKKGNPVDYRFLDVNPAFEKLTGLSKEELMNKSVKEVLPKTEDYWIQRYGKVASSANSVRFEEYSVEFDKYFEVLAYAPGIGYFVTLFNDITARKKAEKALAGSEEKFRNLFNNVNDAIFIHDIHGNILEVNAIACMRLKYTRDMFLSMSIYDLVMPASKKAFAQKNKQLAKHKKILYETMHKTRQGNYIPTEINSRMIEYEGKTAVFCVARNITHRRRMEKRIIENEYKYRMLYSNAPLPYQSIGENGRIIEVNDKWLEVMQYSKKEVVGRTFKSFLTKASKADYDEIFPDFKKTGYLSGFKCNMINGGGGELTVSIDGKGVKDKQDNSFRTYCVLRDITVEEKAKNALLESEARYRMLFNLSSNMILALKGKKVALANPATSKVLKYKNTELFNMDIMKIIDATEKNKIQTIISKLNNAETIENIQLIMKDKGRKDIYTQCTFISGKNDKAGSHNLIIMLAKDVTAQMQSEKNVLSAVIETQEKERKAFAENLHDELGPFLSGIKLYVEEIAREDINQTKRNELVHYLKTMADDAIKNTKNISNSLMPSVLTNYGLYKAVERFCNNLKASKKINITLEFNKPGKKYPDKLEVVLYRIIIEMINNTIKHAEAKNIKIKITDNEKILHFIYRDDGKGFDFYQMLNSSKGLGLQNIDSRVKLLGGKARYWSSPRKGVIFGIEFGL